ncbi:MAG TPA: Holliday junction resolvase RuvX [Polyangiaceae bacterium]|nr:Holliday junction resolvase RuvX [Polyangiaceae bacterium]
MASRGAKRKGRTCALDYGEVRIGVAIDDELGLMAHPRGALAAKPEPALLEALRRLVAEHDVRRFVVGLPLDMKGGEGDAARKARAFAQRLADATGLSVELWDERLTTMQARRALASAGLRERTNKRSGRSIRAHVDEAAASAILQAWLEAREGGEEP